MIRWDLVTVGHLSRNRYRGESEDRPYRRTRCICTLIRAGERSILVDPGLPPEQMAAALDVPTNGPTGTFQGRNGPADPW